MTSEKCNSIDPSTVGSTENLTFTDKLGKVNLHYKETCISNEVHLIFYKQFTHVNGKSCSKNSKKRSTVTVKLASAYLLKPDFGLDFFLGNCDTNYL